MLERIFYEEINRRKEAEKKLEERIVSLEEVLEHALKALTLTHKAIDVIRVGMQATLDALKELERKVEELEKKTP